MSDRLVQRLLDHHPLAAAQTLQRCAPADIAAVLAEQSEATGARLLQFMLPVPAARAVALLPPATAGAILGRLPVSTATQILNCLRAPEREALLHSMNLLHATALRHAMRYPAGTAGSVMHPDVVTFTPEMTLEDARAMARSTPEKLLSTTYVVDVARRPAGYVEVGTLWLAEVDSSVGRIMRPLPRLVSVRANLSTIVQDPAWLSVAHLPVVDSAGTFVGVLAQAAIARAVAGHILSSGSAEATLTDAAVALGELVWTAGAMVMENAAAGRANAAER